MWQKHAKKHNIRMLMMMMMMMMMIGHDSLIQRSFATIIVSNSILDIVFEN